PAVKLGQRIGRFDRGIERYFGPQLSRYQYLISCHVVAIDGSGEILCPLPHFPSVDVCPIKMRLEIAVMACDIADLKREKNMDILVPPVKDNCGAHLLDH